MPEYPDITIYIERLEALVKGQPLEQIRFAGPFFLRTADPPIKTIHGAVVRGVERMGKRIVFVFDSERFLVIHLMIAGRLHWRKKACKLPGKVGLAVFDFPNGSLLITEAGTKKRASLHFINGMKWEMVFRTKLPPSEKIWPCTVAIKSRVLSAERRFKEFAMLPTKPITVRCVRPEGNFWRIGPCHDY